MENINYNDRELFFKIQEKLADGLIVKNYNELTELLELPTKTGKSKQLQLQDLERFFSYEKQGQKFVITDVYASPLEKIDRRINPDNEILTTYIESILLLEFWDNGSYSFSMTKKDFWKKLGMINQYYSNYDKNLSIIQAENYKVKPWMLKNFYSRSRTIIDNKTKSALTRLSKRKLIMWEEVLYKCSAKDGKHYEVTNAKEKAMILACQKKVLNLLNCKSIDDVNCNKDKNIDYNLYKKMLDKELYEQLNIKYIYKRYKVICNREYLKQGLKENYDTLMHYVNDKIVSIVDDDADRVQERYTDCRCYAEVQKYLSNKLLRLDDKLQGEFYSLELEEELPFLGA